MHFIAVILVLSFGVSDTKGLADHRMSFAIKNTEQSGVNTRILRGVDLEVKCPDHVL